VRDGKFLKNMSGHNSVINALAVNEDDVLVSCGDNGSMYFWDYQTGYNFQRCQTIVQPGSLDAEAGIFSACFDMSGTRLLTAEADKSIKIWREDPEATEETHPIDVSLPMLVESDIFRHCCARSSSRGCLTCSCLNR
jgi:pleiotropic regulator 1